MGNVYDTQAVIKYCGSTQYTYRPFCGRIKNYILEVFNETMFKEDNPKLYQQYLCKTTKINKGKKGYVRITLPKVVDYSRLNGGNE